MTMNMSASEALTALAVFVKTPGFSPLKTRLAASLNRSAADAFYQLSCAAIAELLQELTARSSIKPYWAVAESETEALANWPLFPTVTQGDGGLGQRLARVYQSLYQQFGRVVIIGADAPQLSVLEISRLCLRLQRDVDFVLGPARDGGFYLLAGSQPIEASVFTSVGYSQQTTYAELLAQLNRMGRVEQLSMKTDIDDRGDLKPLYQELKRLAQDQGLLPQQQNISIWLEQLFNMEPFA